MIQGFPQEDSDSEQQEQGENAEEEEEAGYGGIKMASVGEIIAKARFNESYLHVNLGLGENLEELATHFGSEENGVCVCVCVCVCTISVLGAEVVVEEVEPAPSGELDLSGIDDTEIDKVSSQSFHCTVY